jgi:hypothetical protein
MAGNKIYQAREPFLADVGGVQMVIQSRTTVREGHPLLDGREHLFEPFTVDYEWTAPAERPAVALSASGPSGTPRTRTAKTAE